MEVLLISNDNLVQLVGLQDVATGSYVNGATVTCTLKDKNGANVSGATNLSLTYVAASNGNYNGTIEDTVSLTEGDEYTAHIDATSGSLKGHWEVPATARIRRK